MMNTVSANKSSLSTAVADSPAVKEEAQQTFRTWQILRLSTFQIGSAMGDILVASIWNRVLISNFGLPAWPVGLLLALRYFLTPLSLWAGYRSDTHPLWGLHRTPYIWTGRFMMVLSLPFLGLSVGRLEASQTDVVGWLFALFCMLLYGVGSLLSGSPFLALVRDSAPKEKQGLAISMAETTLIIFFAIVGISFSFWMEVYDPAIFWEMIVVTMAVGGFFWFFAIVGNERKRPAAHLVDPIRRSLPDFRATFATIWQDGRTRRFFIFLALATLAAWTQETILEPFGAEVFNLEVGETTRFNSYWQSATVLTLLVTAFLGRKRRPEQQTRIAKAGLFTMAAGIGLLALAAFMAQPHLVQLALVVFGGGFGVYTFGGLSLMAVMTSDKEAGAYLGLWTIAVLVSRGIGTGVGAVLRDGFLALTDSAVVSYGVVFTLEAIGLAAAALILSAPQILSFAHEHGRPAGSEPLIVEMGD
jgi:BCD family chlorophyll transporter-like MFS transporter